MPEAVHVAIAEEEKTLALAYDTFTVILIKAVQELAAQVEAQSVRIAALETKSK